VGCPAAAQDWDTHYFLVEKTMKDILHLTILLVASSALAQNYYVSPAGSDLNPGTQTQPWLTIQHAANVATAGTTVHVLPGTYNVSTITTSTSGTASQPIKFISDTKYGARVVGTGDSIWAQRGNYVEVIGFDITASNAATRIGFEWTGNNGKVNQNRIHDIQCSGCGGNGGAGINLDNGSDYTSADANRVYNLNRGATSSTVHCIYLHVTNNIISNNLLYECGGWGVQQWHVGVGHSTIVNNTIFSSNGGIVLGSGGSPGSDYNFVGNNTLVNNNYGIIECCISSAQGVGLHQAYTSNLVWNNSIANLALQWSGILPVNGLASDPRFVNYQADGSGDYHLQSNSPARNAASSQNAPPFDFDGASRSQGAELDIGAYEFVAVSPPTALNAVVR
jgi:hypothetical protein